MEILAVERINRIQLFDTTKGILMLLLIYGHLVIFAKTLNVENIGTSFIQTTVPFYRVFFMQTFFFITGYCTTWNIGLALFLKKNLKTIVLPAFLFLPFSYFAKIIIGHEMTLSSFINLAFSYIINGIPWFLASLFIAKLLFYFTFKICKNKIGLLAICSVLLIFGVYIIEVIKPENIWSYQQALLMIPFMGIGYCIKAWNKVDMGKGNILTIKSLSMASVPYFGIVFLWQIMGLGIGFPAVDYYIDIVPLTVPFYIIFAISGTALILLIAKLINGIDFINLLGRQSLFIYLIHPVVAYIIISMIKIYCPIFLKSIFFFPAVYVTTIMVLLAGSKLMGTKYFSWMVGKF